MMRKEQYTRVCIRPMRVLVLLAGTWRESAQFSNRGACNGSFRAFDELGVRALIYLVFCRRISGDVQPDDGC